MGSLISKCVSNLCRPCCGQSLLKRDPSFSGIITANQTLEGNGVGDEGIQPIKQYSWDTRPKLNPLDYTVCDLRDGDQSVKHPGDVNGQQFIIRNCSNSKIYVFDHSSQVTIDDCYDCLIVLGPIQGSVFLRDTKNSTLVCASSQLRLRDCQNIHLFVGTESDPIIEASTEIVVAPYFLSYKGIKEHFNSAKLSRFKAVHWSEIYDFTPNDLTPNWKRYDKTKHHPDKFICAPTPSECYEDLEISVGDKYSSFIPVTYPNADPVEQLPLRSKWKQQDAIFQQKPGQDLANFEGALEKFYLDTFIQGRNGPNRTILCGLKYNANQVVFSYIENE